MVTRTLLKPAEVLFGFQKYVPDSKKNTFSKNVHKKSRDSPVRAFPGFDISDYYPCTRLTTNSFSSSGSTSIAILPSRASHPIAANTSLSFSLVIFLICLLHRASAVLRATHTEPAFVPITSVFMIFRIFILDNNNRVICFWCWQN